MSDVYQKIGVSFAVEGSAAADVVWLNTAITDSFGSQVRFGPDANSQPHVTVALGEADQDALARVIALVGEAARTTEPFTMAFGPIARETVTGRYVLADVYMPDPIRHRRSALRARIANHLSGLGRTTDEPHLTVGGTVGDGEPKRFDPPGPAAMRRSRRRTGLLRAGARRLTGQPTRRSTVGYLFMRITGALPFKGAAERAPSRKARSLVRGAAGAPVGGLAQGPVLARRAVAGRQDRHGPVGRPVVGRAQAQSRLDAGDRAVGVHVPLLVRAAVAVPDDGPGPR